MEWDGVAGVKLGPGPDFMVDHLLEVVEADAELGRVVENFSVLGFDTQWKRSFFSRSLRSELHHNTRSYIS